MHKHHPANTVIQTLYGLSLTFLSACLSLLPPIASPFIYSFLLYWLHHYSFTGSCLVLFYHICWTSVLWPTFCSIRQCYSTCV